MQEAQPHMHLKTNPLVERATTLAETCRTVDDLYEAKKTMDLNSLGIVHGPVPCTPTNIKNPIMILGKSPGGQEIEQNQTFVGPAAQILREALKNGNQEIDQFHLTYASSWRPRKDNTPNATQLAISYPFLKREIEIIEPRKILVLGAKATDTLFGGHEKMDENEEHETQWNGFPIVILRNNGFVMRHPKLKEQYAQSFKRHGYQ